MCTAIDSRSSSSPWGGTGGPPILLSSCEDSAYFSESICILRAQIELFAATPEDVMARSKKGGLQEPLRLGRVGIRCLHCRFTPHESRARGAISYPNSTRLFNQAFRNWKRYHFPSCKHIPADVRQRVEALEAGPKRQYSSGVKKASTKDFWCRHLEQMGLVDYEDGDGVQFMNGSPEGTNEETVSNFVGLGTVESNHLLLQQFAEGEEIFARIQEQHQTPQNGVGSGKEVAGIRVESDVAHAQDSNSFAKQVTSIEVTPASTCRPTLNSVDPSKVAAKDYGAFPPEEQACDTNGFGTCEDNDRGLDWLNIAFPDFSSKETCDKSIGNSITCDDALDHAQRSIKQGRSQEPAQLAIDPEARDDADQLDERKEHIMGLTRLAQEVVRTTCQMKVLAPMSNSTTASVNVSDAQYSQNDLFALGVDLFELFANRHPFDGKDDLQGTDDAVSSIDTLSPTRDSQQRKRERAAGSNHSFVPLRELGFPVSLCTLVSNLLDPRSSPCPYESFEDVENDLNAMVSDPQHFLFDTAVDKSMGITSDFGSKGKLYGREEQLSILLATFDRVTQPGGKNEIAMIRGYSGTGKSTLVHYAKHHLTSRGGFFVSGKFDLLQHVQPLSTIASAFNEYCDLVLEGDAEFLGEMRTMIQDAVGPNGKVLTDLIPHLKRIIGEQPATSLVSSGKEAENRLIFLLRAFVRTISRPSHPLILFLDDLQWADSASLEMIRALVTDPQTTNLFFVGCYRDNEVGEKHPAGVFMSEISRLGINMNFIEVGNMSRDDVAAIISDALHLLPRLSRLLAEAVFSKTSGNTMLVMQFLSSLYEDGLLRFSLSTRQWEWDLEAIQTKPVTDDAAGLMASKLQKLSHSVQECLKMAACLGTRCEISLLDTLDPCESNVESSSLQQCLDIAVGEGLMFKDASSYMFAHDQIQQAAYSLIPVGERQASHLEIGRRLWQSASAVELEKNIFSVVDQLRRGSDLISDHSEKVQFAELCLVAGEKAMATSSFLSASIYLLQGTTLLEETDWTSHYDLSLRLFSCCAEAQYVLGNHDGVTITTDIILERGRCLQDKLRAHDTVLRSLGTQAKPLSALNYGLKILEQLGHTFPKEINEDDYRQELFKTQALLEGSGIVANLDSMGQMTDEKTLATMKLLFICAWFSYHVNSRTASFMAFRQVQLTVTHGLCGVGPCGFVSLGAIMCSVGKYKLGAQYGRIALSLLEKSGTNEYLVRVYTPLYCMLNVFSSPMQANISMLKHSYEIGMSVGDNEGAMRAALTYVEQAIQSGSQLGPLAEEVKSFVEQIRESNHQHCYLLTLLHYQVILNLMGDSDDPTVLTGDAMNADEVFSIEFEKRARRFCFLRIWLAYMFRRYDIAMEVIDRHGAIINSMRTGRPFRSEYITFDTFYAGLTAVALAHESKEEEWRTLASEAINKLKVWAEESSWNFQHKVELLSAEIAYYLDGDEDRAGRSYDEAILLAGAHGFVHEQALACERAGIFYMNCGCASAASEYFEQSCKWYRKWGAEKKATDISENFLDLLGNANGV